MHGHGPEVSGDQLGIILRLLQRRRGGPKRADDQRLDLGCRHARDGARVPALQHGLRDVVAVPSRALSRMARGHGVAPVIPDAAKEQALGRGLLASMLVMVRGQFGLHRIPGRRVDDRRMLALMDPALVGEPADIDRVRQNGVEMPTAERLPARAPPCPVDPLRHTEAGIDHMPLLGRDGAALEIAREDGPDQGGVLLHDVQGSIADPIAERDHSAHPDALLLRSRDLVPDTLARDLALELGKGQEHV
jgi:hypothetical protein